MDWRWRCGIRRPSQHGCVCLVSMAELIPADPATLRVELRAAVETLTQRRLKGSCRWYGSLVCVFVLNDPATVSGVWTCVCSHSVLPLVVFPLISAISFPYISSIILMSVKVTGQFLIILNLIAYLKFSIPLAPSRWYNCFAFISSFCSYVSIFQTNVALHKIL